MSQNSSLPAPLILPNSGRWLGNDGNWSTFAVQVGTPAQHFSVLPNFSCQTLYVPDTINCDYFNNISDCAVQRGAEVPKDQKSIAFQSNLSSTWQELGYYAVDTALNYGLTGIGTFGYDDFRSGSSASRNEILLQKIVVGSYGNADYFWIGQLGLSSNPIRFSDSNVPSFLYRMKEDGKIPSLSFAYQVGAAHRYNRVSSSLILGGYDNSLVGKSILQSTNKTFSVGLQSIVTKLNNGTEVRVLTEGIMAVIETNFSDLWLPKQVCDSLAALFNLIYSEENNRYILTDEARSKLLQAPPTFSFRLGTAPSSNDTINIEIPYAAFDLQATFPIFPNRTNYFPLRRAQNDSQYALGRAFLQEVYISADLERSTFNLSQAVFNNPPFVPVIVPIEPVERAQLRPPNSTYDSPSPSTKPGGVIAGITVSVVSFVCFLGVLIWWLIRRRRKIKEVSEESTRFEKSELPTSTVEELPYETFKTDLELDGTAIGELHAPHGAIEMEAPKGVEMDAPHGTKELDAPHGREGA